MLILAFETSCDETSIALVRDGVELVGHSIYSQADIHARTGGVIPEVASREHIVTIIPLLKGFLEDCSITQDEIDAIAVTYAPGLIGSLLVGVETAKTLAYAWKKPLIPVNHIFGHIYSVYLERKSDDIHLPAIVLTVSGGHNDIYYFKNHNQFQNIGKTLDDAAGEAFDKIAKMLHLPYPGGPHISRLALSGDKSRFSFPKPMIDNGYQFSFSGLKTAVRYTLESMKNLSEQDIADIAASFQEAVCQTLAIKVIRAVEDYKVTTLFVVGGVSANKRLREIISEALQDKSIQVFFPVSSVYCTDNAAMIGAAAFFLRSGAKYREDIFTVTAQSMV